MTEAGGWEIPRAPANCPWAVWTRTSGLLSRGLGFSAHLSLEITGFGCSLAGQNSFLESKVLQKTICFLHCFSSQIRVRVVRIVVRLHPYS